MTDLVIFSDVLYHVSSISLVGVTHCLVAVAYTHRGQSNLAKGDIARHLSISFVTTCHGRHLGFDTTRNSAIRSADPEDHPNAPIEPNMKWIG